MRLCENWTSFGFNELPSPPFVVRYIGSQFGGYFFIIVYLDDIIILSDTDGGLQYDGGSLRPLYEIRFPKTVDWFFGAQLRWTFDQTRNCKTLHFSKPLHTKSVLCIFGMESAKSVLTSMIESFWTSVSAERKIEVLTIECSNK